MTSYETKIKTRGERRAGDARAYGPRRDPRWSPLPFEVQDLDGETLATGSVARVSGSLAGMSVGFDVTCTPPTPMAFA